MNHLWQKSTTAFLTTMLLALVSLNVNVAAQPTITEIASVEGITEYRLDNGLQVLLFPDNSKQKITVNVTYLVGSRHEGYGETGMAHLLEHLVFKGTPDHPDLTKELTERGVSANGTTWLDRTNYYETFTASEENLKWALALEADRMVNSFIAKEDLESEMTVVRNEWERGENSPGGVLAKRITSAAFSWHNYGNSTIGARSDIENVPIERLQAFYRKYYQPDNAVLVVAGQFDVDFALQAIKDTFGLTPRPDRTGANKIYPTYTVEPTQDGEKTVTLRRVGDVQLVRMAFHIPATTSLEYPAVQILRHVLGNVPAGRLYQNLVEKELAASTYAYTQTFSEPGLLFLAADVRMEDSLEAAEVAMLETIADLSENPPTEEEIARAITDYSSNIELAFNNPQTIALQISEVASAGDWRLLFLYRDAIEEVTPEQVLAAAEKYLIPSNRTTGYFLPVDETPPRAEIPEAVDVDALVADYKSTKVIELGEEFDPSPTNIDTRTSTTTLSNGVEVALLPKKNRGASVNLSFAFRHGSEEALADKAIIGQLTGSMLMRGTTEHSRQETYDELDRLRAQGGVSGDVTITSSSMTTIRESLPELIPLVAEIFQKPLFDEKEFTTLKEMLIANVESQLSEPQPLASIAINKHLTQYESWHPYYVFALDERAQALQSVTIDDVTDFHDTFYGAEGGTISVVGDFDVDEVLDLLEESFGNWRAPAEYKRIDRFYKDIEPLSVDIETPDKSNAVMFARFNVPMRNDHPDFPAMRVGVYIVGGGLLHSRLATRIRQNEGLSYGVGASFFAHPKDEIGSFSGYAIFAPENANKVLVAFEEELDKVLADGITQEELEVAKKGILDSAQRSRAEDGNIASQLASNLFFDRTMAFQAEQEELIANLTVEDVNEALTNYLSMDKISIVRAGDFANKLTTVEGE